MVLMNHNNNPKGTAVMAYIPNLMAYIPSSSLIELKTCSTRGKKNMSGTRNLATYQGLMKPWILGENLKMLLY